MSKKTILQNYEDFLSYTGKEIAVSEYLKITQERVNIFAEATSDHQWIHLDQERARKETPFGGTIAHGYLTLCLAPYFIQEILDFPGVKMVINYSLNNMKLTEPVKVGDKLRMRVTLIEAKNLRGTIKASMKLVFEIQGGKIACTAEVVYLYRFD